MYLVLLELALPLSRASVSEQGFCSSSMKHAGRALQQGDIIIPITVPSTKGFATEFGIWRGGFLADPLTAVPVLREQPIGQSCSAIKSQCISQCQRMLSCTSGATFFGMMNRCFMSNWTYKFARLDHQHVFIH